MRKILNTVLLLWLLASCYYQGEYTAEDAWSLTERQIDSLSFYATHHYTQNFNFLVRSDSLELIAQHPTEYLSGLQVDTLRARRGDHIVVADIAIMSADSIESVWVKVARDQYTMGWIQESRLLPAVSPDTPISLFIDLFSEVHRPVFFLIILAGLGLWLVRRQLRLSTKLVYVDDIDSFYPSLLCLAVATSAVLYGSIQLFAPDAWQHYYYHPTLNPFAVPASLAVLLASLWVLLIVAIATVDDTRHLLRPGEAVCYYLTLAGLCSLCYMVFSISTPCYIGYALYAAYLVFSVWWWKTKLHA